MGLLTEIPIVADLSICRRILQQGAENGNLEVEVAVIPYHDLPTQVPGPSADDFDDLGVTTDRYKKGTGWIFALDAVYHGHGFSRGRGFVEAVQCFGFEKLTMFWF